MEKRFPYTGTVIDYTLELILELTFFIVVFPQFLSESGLNLDEKCYGT